MNDYNNKIVKGTPIRGEHLCLARAQSIYRAALCHPCVTDVKCLSNAKNDEIVCFRFVYLEVPDEPVYDIREEEEIAIICHKEDILLPEVYALRKDFPTELPHSNARPFARPVSLCVSDVSFSDIRPQFNAFDFLNYIRRWLSLNSINQLHESDRPLEVFFAANEICCLMNFPDGNNPYVKFRQKSLFTSTLEFVKKGDASHYLVWLPTEKVFTRNFARIPQTIGDLRTIKSTDQYSLVDILRSALFETVAGKSNLPLLLMVYITQQNSNGKETSENLFAIKVATSPLDITLKKNKLSETSFESWLNGLEIKVVLMTGMISRQENAKNNGIVDLFSKVTIIGTGTLGSAVIDHFVREGCAEEVAFVDFDYLFPHNISRHTLTTNKLMTSKVRSIKESYRGILNQKITAVEGNLLALNKKDKERLFDGTQLVIDLSTSIAVERHLSQEETPYRRCTSFLNPKGDEIVLLMEDVGRSHRLDLLEMDYYRNLIEDDRFSRHLEQTGSVRTNNFSCRAESMVLNYENVRVLSAIVSSQIRKYYSLNQHCLCLWHMNSTDGTVVNQEMSVSDWIQYSKNDINVYLSSSVKSMIEKMSEEAGDDETGGCLFGGYDRDYNNIYIYYMIPAPPDSIHTPVSFVRGFGGLTEEYERITRLTYHQVRYLGEWHSHPEMKNIPSADDRTQFDEMSKEQQSQDLPFVQIINGSNGIFVNVSM